MKEILDYISNNSFLTTIIGAIVGGFFSTFTAIYISNKERKERKQDELAREEREEYKNKPEFRIVNKKKNKRPNIEVFLSPYWTKFKDEEQDYEAIFPNDILDKSKHKFIDFELKNIGKSDINHIYICASNQVNTMLVAYDELEMWVKDKFAFYSALYEQKILKGESIILRIYYLEEYQVSFLFNCTISLVFEDEYKHLWSQPFFYEKNVLEPPYKIDYKRYREYVTADAITDYFQQQWYLWNRKRNEDKKK